MTLKAQAFIAADPARDVARPPARERKSKELERFRVSAFP